MIVIYKEGFYYLLDFIYIFLNERMLHIITFLHTFIYISHCRDLLSVTLQDSHCS